MESIPQAYALSLWLRDLGCNDEQIGAVLDVVPDAVASLLRIAELKIERLRSQPARDTDKQRGVLVFVDRANTALIDAAAVLARKRDALLHLVALRQTEPSASEAGFGMCGDYRRTAESKLLSAARRAVQSGIDVVPATVTGRASTAIEHVVRTWGPVTVVLDAEDPVDELQPSLIDPGAEVRLVDDLTL